MLDAAFIGRQCPGGRDAKLHHKRPIGRERWLGLGHSRPLAMSCRCVAFSNCSFHDTKIQSGARSGTPPKCLNSGLRCPQSVKFLSKYCSSRGDSGPMEPEHHLTFGPFRLDTMHGRVWRGAQATTLRPRSLAMLRYLVEQSGRLVTKAELRQHVWAGTHVTDTVLRVSVQEIRAALGDAAAAPQYLETVGRQGYRLLVGGDFEDLPPRTVGPIVGRQQAVARLEGWFQRAAQGTRQLV